MALTNIKNLKAFSTVNERFEGAHLLCPGCAHSMIVRELMNATDDNLVIATNTGCLEVSTAVYPYTSWDTSWIHIGFENAASAVSGAEAMYKARKRKGTLKDPDAPVKFVAFGGDGSTYDIGFQWLSGAVERGHDFTYICLDNENYANTGGQRSSALQLVLQLQQLKPGRVSYGKKRGRKDMGWLNFYCGQGQQPGKASPLMGWPTKVLAPKIKGWERNYWAKGSQGKGSLEELGRVPFGFY